ncbi:O-fucosyltransferase family protein [Sporobolomyces salmoneus]|uniref:O-fucosyltransferase family protein n=1 Tax=Sporobolomyces salmoneus TaxID=183962 RepID=UPI003175CB12
MSRRRSPTADITLNGAVPFSFPSTAIDSSTPSGPLSRRPAARTSPDLDVWYHPSTSSGDSTPIDQQPTFSFPTASASPPPPSPPPKETVKKTGFYKNSSSIAHARSATIGAKMNWRDKGQDYAALRKKASSQEDGIKASYVATGVGALALVAMVFVLVSTSKNPTVAHMKRREAELAAALAPTPVYSPAEIAVKKHDSFRDELATDMQYVTTPQTGDFADQTLNLYHLAHLAAVLQRIPIAMPLAVSSLETPLEKPQMPVSSIYDMSRFSHTTSIAMLDWQDLKPDLEAEKAEKLGCWTGALSAPEVQQRAESMWRSGLATSFVPVRVSTARTKLGETVGDELMATHRFIATFDHDASAKSGLIEQAKHDRSIHSVGRASIDPDDHLLCIDSSLHRPEHPTTLHTTTHLDPRDHSAFFSHGRHLHFNRTIHDLAGNVVSHLLGHRNHFLAVHISARARASECRLLNQLDHCEPILEHYTHAVERIKHLLTLANGSAGHRKSREHLLDYEDLELREKFGTWSPEVLTSAIESRAAGFVGTRGSSQSTLSALRVRTWHKGPTELL